MLNSKFIANYPVAASEYQNAVKLMEMGVVIGSLASARVSLESVVKEFCKKCGVDTSDTNLEITLQDMIDVLKENGIITEQETAILHRTRILCNKGVHPGAVPPTQEEAREATELLADILLLFAEKDDVVDFAQKAQDNNQPMVNSDYYSPKRRYRGDWSECYTHEDLAVIPEYTELVRRADAGDITAMLDLAIGFVHKNPVWSPNQLICMPKYRFRGQEYFQNRAYDTRYYYWIFRACDTAICAVELGRDYPKKYMANAFMDAMKFAISVCASELQFYVTGVQYDQNSAQEQLLFSDQYQLVQELYGASLRTLFENPFCWARELLRMVQTAGTLDIISDLHRRERSFQGIQYLAYCFCCMKHYCDMPALDQGGCGMKDCVLDREIALCSDDVGMPVTLELLAQRTPEYMRDAGYEQLIRELCAHMKKTAEKEKNHPKLATVERIAGTFGQKLRQLAEKFHFAQEVVFTVTGVPVLLACGTMLGLAENMPSGILLPMAMALVVLCSWAQGKLAVYFKDILYLEADYMPIYRWLGLLFEKGLSVLMIILLFMLASVYDGIIEKIVIYAAIALSVYVNPVLRGLYKESWLTRRARR